MVRPEQIVKVKGVVKEFLEKSAFGAVPRRQGRSGNVVTYSLEMGSPNTLAKRGMTRYMLKPGDEVEMEEHPSYNADFRRVPRTAVRDQRQGNALRRSRRKFQVESCNEDKFFP